MLGTALAYMALAFFIARISLAAAIAAGEARRCVCAPAGTAGQRQPQYQARGRQNSRKALHSDSPRLRHYRRSTTRIPWAAPAKHRRAGQTDEQSVLDHARYRIQQSRQARRIGYSSQMGIDNPVAAIGDENVTVLAVPDHHLPGNAAFGKCPGHARAASPPGRTESPRPAAESGREHRPIWNRRRSRSCDRTRRPRSSRAATRRRRP